ncbi:MAG: hypothetical protein ACI9M9_001930 [Flavobacteriaceae bacterium]|jgi:hypothetical protein
MGLLKVEICLEQTMEGVSLGTINNPIGEMNPGNWVTPFDQHPILSNTIYVGYTRVHRSRDKGITWTPVSQDFGAKLDHLKISS